jgi:hypothetical protein
VVDEHPDATLRGRTELPHDRIEIVDALEILDHDTLDPQVVAPHLLDELRVVAALDEDAACPRHPRRMVGDGDRA